MRAGLIAAVAAVACSDTGSRTTLRIERTFGELSTQPIEVVEPYEYRGRLAAMPVSDANELEARTRGYLAAHRAVFGDLELIADGAMIDRDHEFASIVYAQRYRGIPVVGAHLAFAVSRGRLILVQGNAQPITGVASEPRYSLADGLASLADGLPGGAGDRDHARLVVLPPTTLAWEITAWRGQRHYVINIDAVTGETVSAYDANHYDYHGRATHDVDARTVGDQVVTLPAEHLKLNSPLGSTLTDGKGAFSFTDPRHALGIRQPAAPLIVTAELAGRFVDVRRARGQSARFVGALRPERPNVLEWDEARAEASELDVFRGVNTTNRFAATVFPDLAWLKRPVAAYVDHPQTCNAYWNGSSINFFKAGNGCNNSGRIFDVIAHEWGHGLDQNAPGGASNDGLGEFIGDLLSFAQTNSHLLAPNFFVDGKAVRDLKDPAYRCYDPKKRQVHAAGQLLGAVMFDVMEDLKAAGVTGERLKRLLLRPIAIAQSRAEWYGAMLAVDDDNGDLTDGTPNECLIYNQFKAHSCGGTRWPGIPPEDPPHCR